MKTVGIFDIFKKKERPSFKGGSYPLKSNRRLPIVEGYIDNKKYYFIVDTGATISVFDEDVYREKIHTYKLHPSDMEVQGYGGSIKTLQRIYRFSVDIGGVPFNDKWYLNNISHIIDAIKDGTGIKISGIIGNNNLKKRNIIIDLNHNELRISEN